MLLTDSAHIAGSSVPKAGEISFGLDEVLYSRTDKRGVIEGCNTVFQRLAGYDWDRLKGAPHRVVRHPEMPKGLFHLMWSRLKADRPMGAYVRNRSEDGRYYWVFAVVSPTRRGYISVRFKPLTPLRDKAEEVYAHLLAAERGEGLTPEQSAQRLEEEIAALGYADYDAFQAHLISEEMAERAKALGQKLDPRVERFRLMGRAIREIETETKAMMAAFDAIRTIPLNMRILASRLESAGGPISAISVNYGAMSDEMSGWVKTFIHGADSSFARISSAIWLGLFYTCAIYIETHAVACIKSEADKAGDHVDTEDELMRLEGLVEYFEREAADHLNNIEAEAGRLARSVLDMKRYITGLSSTRMMCKIESATLPRSGETLVGIVDQLDASQDGIEERLARINELNQVVQSNSAMLKAGRGLV